MYCGERKLLKNLQIDHKYPVGRGGSTDKSDLQLLCRPCNLRKVSPHRRGVPFGEETITDLLMLDLNRLGPAKALFTPTSKPVEANQGTDFECWVGSDDAGWLRFAIQSKKRVAYAAGLSHPGKGHLIQAMRRLGPCTTLG